MKIEINMTDTEMDLNRFSSREDLRQFFLEKNIDGLELMPCGKPELPGIIEPEDVVGIHLRYFPCWLEFWRGNEKALAEEFGNREVWAMNYGGTTREDFLKQFRAQLELAQRIGAKYVVFHVSECTLNECVTYKPLHSDMEVVEAAAEVINALLDGKNYDFCFLVENLWWSGLNLMDNAVTKALMDRIHYPQKGIMLDTGHLLHTSLEIKSQEDGVPYIHQVLDRMEELTRYIKGIHLNQSISSDYVKTVIAAPKTLKGTYWERLSSLYPHIGKIDYHEPFTADGVAALIRRIAPEFVTIELITSDRQQHEDRLNAQMKALNEQGGIR